MANSKLHTMGSHGGFHRNFLYKVVRTVLFCAKKQSTLEEESLLRTFILEFEETTLKGFIATINIGGLGHPALLKGRIFQTIPRCMVEYR